MHEVKLSLRVTELTLITESWSTCR